jgi:hypothetical protein
LGSSSGEADGEEADGKVAYGKDAGSGKAVSEEARGFLADFALSMFWSSTKSYKERFGIYLLKPH